MVGIPEQLAKALVYPVHLTEIVGEGEDSTWNLRTVDAVTSDRAYGIEKGRNELGYFPAHALEDGLRETVEWYRQNGIILRIGHGRVLVVMDALSGVSPLRTAVSRMWFRSEPRRCGSGRARSR